MTAPDLEAEYNNRARVPEHPAIFARWERDAAAYRQRASAAGRADLGVPYGSSPRQIVDIFRSDQGESAPLAVFIHGGYWRSLSPALHSHLAAGLNAHGVTVALVGYDLCPQVSVATIIGQVRQAIAFLHARHGRPMLVTGHSAGGHLAACMLATDWPAIAQGLPADLTPAGISISGVFDLVPLVSLSMNADLRLEADEARSVSPIHWPVAERRSFDALVGARESSEFLRQSRAIADAWGASGVATRYGEIAGGDHFTAVDPLSDPDSDLVARAAALAARLG